MVCLSWYIFQNNRGVKYSIWLVFYFKLLSINYFWYRIFFYLFYNYVDLVVGDIATYELKVLIFIIRISQFIGEIEYEQVRFGIYWDGVVCGREQKEYLYLSGVLEEVGCELSFEI